MNEPAGGASGAATAGPDTPGGLLRAERERRGYSVQHAAEEMHLDAWVIEAIEANRFEALGAPVYARGHLRKYATLLGVSPATVIERYEALGGTPVEPTPIPVAIATPVRPERRRVSRLPLWIAAAIVIVAGLAWLAFELLWSPGSGSAPTTEVVAPTASDPAVSEPVEQTSAVVAPTTPAPTTPAATTPTPVAPPATVVSTPASSGEVRLRLEFTEPSWAEIYDATGKRLMFAMGQPGRVRNVAGAAPLRVNLGLASAVNAQVNERPIVIPRRAGKDGAKFLIEADGSVRPDTLKTAVRE
jgi:cytoskeleton protein RodZ